MMEFFRPMMRLNIKIQNQVGMEYPYSDTLVLVVRPKGNRDRFHVDARSI
jgi:hypothetical protein